MARSLAVVPVGTTPARGDTFPLVTGPGPDGAQRSARDYYMRRNLAVVVSGEDSTTHDWLRRIAALRERIRAEDAEVLVIAPAPVDTGSFDAILDDGTIGARLGLSGRTTPAVFILDRYGIVFATNAGASDTPDLQPEDIPRWLEFVACRCT